jgi:hypothetical protein
MPREDLIEAGAGGTVKVWPDERGDDVTRPPGDVVDCLGSGTVAEHAAPGGGIVRLCVAEALVNAAADDDDLAAVAQAALQFIADQEY